MLVPLSWLREFAPFDLDPYELGGVFDDLGMVVEAITEVGGNLEGVVVARVLDIKPIEGLDRVRMTTVDAGNGDTLEVACGAWNFEIGDLVPLATVGTTLPNGMTIGQRKMRGVVSNGMLCSPDELKLGESHEGLLILPADLETGTPFADAMGIDADVVYDLAIEGNRPDANSVVGVARDAAARLRLPFHIEEHHPHRGHGATIEGLSTVEVRDPDLCPLFTVTAIMGVELGPSPLHIQRRLTLAGMRPINNVVDASNYVMLELGQPTHPYDLALVAGGGFIVRRALDGEQLETLDGVKRTFTAADLLICDSQDDPLGIAGIMGGASSEIADTTEHVLLEAACFDAMTIARTAKRLNLRTEASARFERGVDHGGVHRAVDRYCEILSSGEVAPGTLEVRAPHLDKREHIVVRPERVNALLGTGLSPLDIEHLLRPIGFATSIGLDGEMEVVPPTYRPDVELEVDVIEEVARHHGYSRITRTLPRSPDTGALTPYQRERRRMRETLAGAGLSEALTNQLLGPGDHERAGISGAFIQAANPLVREESLLRTSLLPGLLRAAAHNVARRVDDVALFEVGHVFLPPDPGAELPDEREHIAAIAVARDAAFACRLLDLLAGVLRVAEVQLHAAEAEGLHPTRTAAVSVDGAAVGHVGEVDPRVVTAWDLQGRVAWLQLDVERLLAASRRPAQQQPVSRFPSNDIDLAFVVPEAVPAGEIASTITAAAGELLESVVLFDVYRGEAVPDGTRSLAYRLRFSAQDRTLSDDEIGEIRQGCIDAVTSAGATLRA